MHLVIGEVDLLHRPGLRAGRGESFQLERRLRKVPMALTTGSHGYANDYSARAAQSDSSDRPASRVEDSSRLRYGSPCPPSAGPGSVRSLLRQRVAPPPGPSGHCTERIVYMMPNIFGWSVRKPPSSRILKMAPTVLLRVNREDERHHSTTGGAQAGEAAEADEAGGSRRQTASSVQSDTVVTLCSQNLLQNSRNLKGRQGRQ